MSGILKLIPESVLNNQKKKSRLELIVPSTLLWGELLLSQIEAFSNGLVPGEIFLANIGQQTAAASNHF